MVQYLGVARCVRGVFARAGGGGRGGGGEGEGRGRARRACPARAPGRDGAPLGGRAGGRRRGGRCRGVVVLPPAANRGVPGGAQGRRREATAGAHRRPSAAPLGGRPPRAGRARGRAGRGGRRRDERHDGGDVVRAALRRGARQRCRCRRRRVDGIRDDEVRGGAGAEASRISVLDVARATERRGLFSDTALPTRGGLLSDGLPLSELEALLWPSSERSSASSESVCSCSSVPVVDAVPTASSSSSSREPSGAEARRMGSAKSDCD